jgi:cell division protein FtsN
MRQGEAYTNKYITWRTLIIFRIFALVISLSSPLTIKAQQEQDEIPVFLEIPRVGGFEIPAVIKGQDLYLPIKDLFDFLKIRNVPSADNETVSGFFISPEAEYIISHKSNQVTYQGKIFNLEPGDLIRTESDLFMKAQDFGKIFGLDCSFSFRNLSVKLTSKLEIPLIREMKQEEMRQNLRKLKGEVKADTNIDRSYPLFRFGVADWSAISTQEINGKTNTRLNIALGANIAGGEATASINYYNPGRFDEKQQYYLWRYVDNDFKFFKQAMIGKIATNATSSLLNPVVGVQFTNTPTNYRHSFGSYTLSDKTEPGWIVELYVNNVLVDYAKADASGFFKFEVPLVYGNSVVKLKFFGPWGEESVREQNINIPYNFLPKNTLEYQVSAGIVEDSSMNRFARVRLNYGLASRLTLGTGVEYLSSVKSGPAMPFVDGSFSVLRNLLLSGEFTYGVRSRGTLSYSTPSNIHLDLNYTWYNPDQKAIMYNYREERKASVSIPVIIKSFSSFNRLSFYQVVLPYSKYSTGEWMISSSIDRVGINLTSYAIFIENTPPNLYSNLSLAVRLPGNFVIMPQAQYGYNRNEFFNAKIGIEKNIRSKAFLNFSYEQNFVNNMKLAEAGFRYNFGFAQAGGSVRQINRRTSFTEYARGSLIYDRKTKYVRADNQFNVGKGGIAVIPYLDINANGIKDPGEPKAFGLNLRANGGRIEKNEKDTTIIITGLEPYTKCFIELDGSSFDNISWRLPVETMNIEVDPDILKHIEIPVSVVGEVSGAVSMEREGHSSGQGRIIIKFFKENKPAGSALTEDDGYYSMFGFDPGHYSLQVDTVQLSKLGMVAEPGRMDFFIRPGLEGDVVEHLDFKLRILHADTASTGETIPAMITQKDTTYLIIHEVTQEVITISRDCFAIQLGAFRNKSNAETMRRNLSRLLGRKVEIIIVDNYYKVRINEIETRKDVDQIITLLQKNGIAELWLTSLKAMQKQLILKERQDSVIQITEMKSFLKPGKDFYMLGVGRKSAVRPLILDMMEIKPVVEDIKISDLKFFRISEGENTTIINRISIEKVLTVIDIPSFSVLPSTRELVKIKNADTSGFKEKIKVLIRKEDEMHETDKEAKVEPVSFKSKGPVAIQVAIFYKKNEALKARRRISSKLGLQAEIVEQWEFYRVIIPGFSTKEETFRFYPELAGMGYPGVTVIEGKE